MSLTVEHNCSFCCIESFPWIENILLICTGAMFSLFGKQIHTLPCKILRK